MSRSTTSLLPALGLSVAAVVVLDEMLSRRRAKHRAVGTQLGNAFLQVRQLLGDNRVTLSDSDHADGFWASQGSVYYNPRWASLKLNQHCTDPACARAILLGVFGHEFAHILFDDQGYGNSCAINHATELRADALAGWTLARLGSSHDHFQSLLAELSKEASCTHPHANYRLNALTFGYNAALRGVPWQHLRSYAQMA